MTRRLLALLAVPVALAVPGVAHANSNDIAATCDGLEFSMPRGETDTVVRTFLDGALVRTDRVATFGASTAFSVPSPDRTRSHVWVVEVDSVFNADQRIERSVPACVAPTTTSTTSTTVAVTTPPVPTTVPPVVSSTVVTTPRTPTTTVPAPTTTVRFVGELPETGAAAFWAKFSLLAAAIGALGFVLVRLNGGKR